jgi:hypothetical protein
MPGPVRKRKTRCRQKRDSRKWDEYVVRVLERQAARLDSPGAAQGAPSPPQAAASREPEPDPSPAHLRPLAHRVTTSRPDPPTQSALEDYGLSDPITEPDPGLCVETVHHLPVPAHEYKLSPVYQLYMYERWNAEDPHDEFRDNTIRLMHNTLTNRAAVWTTFDNHPKVQQNRKELMKIVYCDQLEEARVLQLLPPQFRWYTATQSEQERLLVELRL